MSEFAQVDFAADAQSAVPYGRYVIRRAPLVFKSGNYPDKNFSMTKDELRLAIADFKKPAPLKIEHKDSILDGKLGEFIRAEYQDGDKEATMSGKVLLPRWLHDLYKDQPIPLSVSWDRATKRIAHVGLVTKPRVEGAAATPDLDVAFAEFKKADDGYRTEHGQMALQQIHDLTAHHGSLCKTPAEVEDTGGGENKSSSKDADEKGSGKTRSDMSVDDPADFAALCQAMFMHGSERDALQVIHDASSKVGAKCNFQPVRVDENGKPLQTGTPAMATSTVSAGQKGYQFSAEDEQNPAVLALRAQLAEAEKAKTEQAAQFEKLRTEKIAADAVHFADTTIAENRAMPAEKQHLIDLYKLAAEADHKLGGTVDFNGGKTSRVAALQGAYAARLPHKLTQELLGNNQNVQVLLSQAGTPDKSNANMSDERKRELLGLTPLGMSILAGSKN